jgi:hypothetical protein
MLRTSPASAVALVAVVLAAGVGCPDPEVVGHAPKAQVDEAAARIEKASKKLDERTTAADAAHE